MIGLLYVLKDVSSRLDQLNIEYFLVGSLASMHYGRPRFTQDIDLVIALRASQVGDFEEKFPLDDYYCPPDEVLHDEVSRKGSFNLIHQKSGIKVDIIMNKETEFYLSEFKRKVKVEIATGIEVFIASPEDIILNKLVFYREGESEKHLLDIREMVMTTKVDRDYIGEWVKRLGLGDLWSKI